jgi:hypothetical protein
MSWSKDHRGTAQAGAIQSGGVRMKVDLTEMIVGDDRYYWKVDWWAKTGTAMTRNFKTPEDAADFAIRLQEQGKGFVDDDKADATGTDCFIGVHYGSGLGDDFSVQGCLIFMDDGTVSYMDMDG